MVKNMRVYKQSVEERAYRYDFDSDKRKWFAGKWQKGYNWEFFVWIALSRAKQDGQINHLMERFAGHSVNRNVNPN